MARTVDARLAALEARMLTAAPDAGLVTVEEFREAARLGLSPRQWWAHSGRTVPAPPELEEWWERQEGYMHLAEQTMDAFADDDSEGEKDG